LNPGAAHDPFHADRYFAVHMLTTRLNNTSPFSISGTIRDIGRRRHISNSHSLLQRNSHESLGGKARRRTREQLRGDRNRGVNSYDILKRADHDPESLMPSAWSATKLSSPASSGWKLPPPSQKASIRRKFGN